MKIVPFLILALVLWSSATVASETLGAELGRRVAAFKELTGIDLGKRSNNRGVDNEIGAWLRRLGSQRPAPPKIEATKSGKSYGKFLLENPFEMLSYLAKEVAALEAYEVGLDKLDEYMLALKDRAEELDVILTEVNRLTDAFRSAANGEPFFRHRSEGYLAMEDGVGPAIARELNDNSEEIRRAKAQKRNLEKVLLDSRFREKINSLIWISRETRTRNVSGWEITENLSKLFNQVEDRAVRLKKRVEERRTELRKEVLLHLKSPNVTPDQSREPLMPQPADLSTSVAPSTVPTGISAYRTGEPSQESNALVPGIPWPVLPEKEPASESMGWLPGSVAPVPLWNVAVDQPVAAGKTSVGSPAHEIDGDKASQTGKTVLEFPPHHFTAPRPKPETPPTR